MTARRRNSSSLDSDQADTAWWEEPYSRPVKVLIAALFALTVLVVLLILVTYSNVVGSITVFAVIAGVLINSYTPKSKERRRRAEYGKLALALAVIFGIIPVARWRGVEVEELFPAVTVAVVVVVTVVKKLGDRVWDTLTPW